MAKARTWAQTRSILLEYYYHLGVRTIADVCGKYGLTPGAFSRLRKEHGHQIPTRTELVLACVGETPFSIDQVIGYMDYRDHARYSEAEVQKELNTLLALKLVRQLKSGWVVAQRPQAKRRFLFEKTCPEGGT